MSIENKTEFLEAYNKLTMESKYLSINQIIEMKQMDITIISHLKNTDEFYYWDLLTNVIGRIYSRVNWTKIASGKAIAPDIFQHRLIYAAKEDSIDVMIERLCSRLDIQASLVPTYFIFAIKAFMPEHMNYLRSRTRIFTQLASDYSSCMKELRKHQQKSTEENEIENN